ncbi:unnamed protein product [Heterobilharzia americana]|nr:unnamed protein product [Heterobilharzia americana]CAH8613810.1 unnamed protein product [Heterobilharzia americana]
MDSSPNVHNDHDYSMPNNKFQQNTNSSQSSEEILDYSMNQLKSSSTSDSSITSFSTESITSAASFLSDDSSFPYSCFTSSAFTNPNLPQKSPNDILSVLLNQKSISSTLVPSSANTLLQQQLNSLYVNTNSVSIPQVKQDMPYIGNYYEYAKLLSNFLNYFSLLNHLNTSNTTDYQNVNSIDVSRTANNKKGV